MASKQRGLGRGLDALFAEQEPINRVTHDDKGDDTEKAKTQSSENSVLYVDLHHIKPNENQPRRTFDEEKLNELAASIIEHGIIQPVIVRQKGNSYEIVAGERRWRAARIAKLREVPCIIKNFTDEENMLVAIIENMQREDLNPIEEAEGIEKIIKTYGMTQEEAARTLGKSRPYITNTMRLLKLDTSILENIKQGAISAGHGRALLGIADMNEQKLMASRIIQEGLSVRELEKIIAHTQGKHKTEKPVATKSKTKNLHAESVGRELSEKFGSKIQVSGESNKGKIEIFYYSNEELEKILQLFK